MKIGYVCPYRKEKLDFSTKLGFDGVELIGGWPGDVLEPGKFDDDVLKKLKEYFESNNISALTVQYGWNYCDSYGDDVKGILGVFNRFMDICDVMETNLLTFNCFVPRIDVKEQEDYISKLYPEIGRLAADRGIKIGIENCPHEGHNYVSTPKTMERFFNLANSESFGLELDPSHMVWLGCDYVEAAKKYGKRVISVHAKDTEVNTQVLKNVGIYGSGWWRYRMPGWGVVDWKGMFTALFENGFDGPVIVEHEDPVFDGELFGEGLKKGKDLLDTVLF